MRVAFAGPAGTFSEQAARVFGSPVAVPGFAGVVRSVLDGEIDAGVLALENAWVGAVPETMELLSEHPVYVTARCVIDVQLCLVALPGTKLEEVKEVHSHPHALAQSRALIERLGARAVPSVTTASAARAVSDGVAAICASSAVLGLEVLVEDAGDRPGSRTRFVRIEREQGEGEHVLVMNAEAVPGRVIGLLRGPGAFETRVLVEASDDKAGGRVIGRYGECLKA